MLKRIIIIVVILIILIGGYTWLQGVRVGRGLFAGKHEPVRMSNLASQ